jgi:PhnB protein
METKKLNTGAIITSIEPWLSVNNGAAAVSFYTAAFGATETYRMEDPGGGLVVKFSVDGAGFWISGEANNAENTGSSSSGNLPVKMILTVSDPDALFAQALKAGATEIFPIGEDYGWRLGRLSDPFGYHWEIGHPL